MEQSKDLDEIFCVALALEDPEARAAYLDEVCGRDDERRRRVERLLEADPLVDSQFLVTPAARMRVPLGSTVGAGRTRGGEGPGSVIGPYKLLEQIGEGGMGTIYMAEQRQPVRRMVALKIIKLGMDTRQVIARFEAERQALAMMDHPNIAKVHDGGATDSGRPYFVMELVRGIPITEYCDKARLSVPDRLELFILVCRAVQHAHQKGVIHRDLKPSNVLVTLIDGVAVPKVIDFGVAKATGQALTDKTLYTGFAQLIGTPLYMSPEQAELSGIDVDTRSDIYSLGVLLYELLTGTTPIDRDTFSSATYDEIRRIVREQEPITPSTRLAKQATTLPAVSTNRRADPRKLGVAVRGELDWIVMKALEKDRRRRYETVAAFAADVVRYLTDQPVEASPPSTWYWFTKYTRRNRVALTTTALVAMALIVGTSVSTWQAIRATRAERRTAAALEVAQAQRRFAQRHLYVANLRQAGEALQLGQVERVQEILKSLKIGTGEPNSLGFVWHYLWRLSRSEIELFDGREAFVSSVVLSPDGHVFATGYSDGTILLRDADSGEIRSELTGHNHEVNVLAFSGNGRMLGSAAQFPQTGSRHPEVMVWDTTTGAQVAKLDRFEGKLILNLGFSRSGRRFMTAWSNHQNESIHLDLFDLLDDPGGPLLVGSQVVEWESSRTFAAGPYVAARSPQGPLTVYDADTLKPRWSTSDRDREVGWPTLSEGGEWLAAVVGADVVVWNAATGRERSRVQVRKPGQEQGRVLVSPDGGKLLVESYPLRVTLVDLTVDRPGPELDLPLKDPAQHLLGQAVFSPDGKKLALTTRHIGGGRGPLTVWDTVSGQLIRTYPGTRLFTPTIFFSSDSRSLFVSGGSGIQRWWFDRPEMVSPESLAGHRDEAWTSVFSPRGDLIATGSDDTDDPWTIKLWDRATGQLRRGWNGGVGTVASLAFTSDGATLAAAYLDDLGGVRLWETATGRLRHSLKGHSGKVRTVAFRHHDNLLASGGDDATIRLWEGATGNPIRTLTGHTNKVRQIVFSPDRATLASASNDGTVRIWNVETGQLVRVLRNLNEVTAVGFAPDGSILAAIDELGTILFWKASTGSLIRRLHSGDRIPRSLAFSPDGTALATAGAAGTIRLWDPVTGQDLLRLEGHKAQVNDLSFSPDGRTLATCSHDGAVMLWRSGDGSIPPSE